MRQRKPSEEGYWPQYLACGATRIATSCGIRYGALRRILDCSEWFRGSSWTASNLEPTKANMTLKIEIEMDNAAFESPAELKRILARIASRIEDSGLDAGPVMDVNGNRVGIWELVNE